ncbi:MAG: hypothetical protein AVDCRST_MAG10-3305 [uncultured Acidimicrobiales bacterium]|uniref:Uncharacterized protein n=1 Tax=uncultured Acidimicrobiales bacterium TaxID=310071 RepID=A0A6J4J5W8_9ACTN|nr:MAG: hypothetical protein AVDCRST_MAG10-3305 [uncultured Acidimicrobiales bacterium]
MPPTSVGWADSRAAVASLARRISNLIRSVDDVDVPALGVWTAGQLAAHLTHVFEIELDLINETASPLADLADLAELTQVRVRDEAVRDPQALARRVEDAAAAFLAVARELDGSEPREWLGQVKATASVLACHIVSESMIHGLDLARAIGRRWPVERGHAMLAFEGFICPMYQALGRPGYAVDQVRAAGVTACYDIRIRGGGRVFFAFAEGGLSIEPPSDRRVDCHLWVDPRALMLLAWHRTDLARPVLTGQVLPWGRRPWLSFRLPGLIKTP